MKFCFLFVLFRGVDGVFCFQIYRQSIKNQFPAASFKNWMKKGKQMVISLNLKKRCSMVLFSSVINNILKKSYWILQLIDVCTDISGDHFDLLPEGWIQMTHRTGIPVYLHRPSRVCTLARPYFLGSGNIFVISKTHYSLNLLIS